MMRLFRILPFCAVLLVGVGMGLGGHKLLNLLDETQLKQENMVLRQQNQLFQDQFDELKKRVNTVEDLSKELTLSAGVKLPGYSPEASAMGGPGVGTEFSFIADLQIGTAQLERQLRELKLDFEKREFALAAVPQGFPVDGPITARFGGRRNPFGRGYENHAGVDIDADFGVPVSTTADGVVLYAASYNGYGNVVVVDHGNGYSTRYGHLSSISVKFGQLLKRGDVLGRVGSTGRSTGTHLHYEVRKDNIPLNPFDFTNLEADSRR